MPIDAARREKAQRAQDADELYRKMLRWVARRTDPDARLVPAEMVMADAVLRRRFCAGGPGSPVDVARVGRALEYLVATERLALVDDRWVIYRIATPSTGGHRSGFDDDTPGEVGLPGFEKPTLPLGRAHRDAPDVQAAVEASLSAWRAGQDHLVDAARQRAHAEAAQELAEQYAAEARALAEAHAARAGKRDPSRP